MRFIYTKAFAIFSGCLVLLAFLVFLQVQGWLDPVRNVFLQSPRPVVYIAKGVSRPVKSFFSSLFQLRKIAEDNSRLKTQNIELQQKLVGYDESKRENETLRKELGFAATAKYSLVACTVISQDFFGSLDALVLNCGSEQGIKEGNAVISQGYLVGRIVYVGKNNSTALLATSSQFSSDVKLSNTGAEAIVTGSFGSGLELDRLSQNNPVEKGWLVVTAGINPAIPKGILVGEVGEPLSAENDLFKKFTLLSPINFSGIEFVFVAKP